MKILISLFTFIILSLSLTCFIGYIDEGNSSNYDSFFNYLTTDAFSDNFITDTGRHGWTIFFMISMTVTFAILNRITFFKNSLYKNIIVSSVSFPITSAGLLIIIFGIVYLLKAIGIVSF